MTIDLIFKETGKVDMARIDYKHPVSGYVQSYADWVDDGYDYDLISAGLIPVYPTSR